jgi:hypothetical protein
MPNAISVLQYHSFYEFAHVPVPIMKEKCGRGEGPDSSASVLRHPVSRSTPEGKLYRLIWTYLKSIFAIIPLSSWLSR